MPPVIQEIAAPPDVAAFARALRGAPGIAVLHGDVRGALAPTDARSSFVACDPIERTRALAPPDPRAIATDGAAAPGWAGAPAAPRWIGVVPYDALRPGLERPSPSISDARPPPVIAAPLWLRYDAVLRVDHATGRVAIEADDRAAASRLLARLRAGGALASVSRAVVDRAAASRAAAADVRISPPRAAADAAHAARIRHVLGAIGRGEVYQVNVARQLRLTASGDPIELFLRLFRAAPAPFGLYVDLGDAVVCAASPELALAVHGDRLRTAPIKGTRPRGADAAADRALAAALDADPKERAELVMAIDLHRNDLGRVSVPGSVRVLGPPRVVAGRTVWSRVAEVVGRLAPGTTRDDVVRAVLPCGSVTGAPKVRAMQIIAEIEADRRGLYTGAFGYVGRDGALVLAMAIRTLELARTAAAAGATFAGVYGSGGGIVADSDPDREVEETRWKAVQLGALGAPAAHATAILG